MASPPSLSQLAIKSIQMRHVSSPTCEGGGGGGSRLKDVEAETPPNPRSPQPPPRPPTPRLALLLQAFRKETNR